MIIIPGQSLPALSNPGVATDLKNGKQLIDANGNVLTGTMPNATQATPSITVSSGGLITATAIQEAGYVASGTKNATKQLTTQAGTTITPGTSQKTACQSGRYTTGNIYVAGDSDLKASNIKDGVTIFGVTGTLEEGTKIHLIELQSGDLTPYSSSGSNHTYRIPYKNGSLPSGTDTRWKISAFCIIFNNMYVATAVTAGFGLSSVDDGNYVKGSPFAGVGGALSLKSSYLQFTVKQTIIDGTMECYNSEIYIGTGSFIAISTGYIPPD